MRKTYTPPMVYCEELYPESMLCGCLIKNPGLNEEWHCGYEPDGLGFTLFASSWDNCQFKEGDIPHVEYCYHAGTVNIFGS